MGYKTRSNYSPGYSLTQERFDEIFKKGKTDDNPAEIGQSDVERKSVNDASA